MSTNTDLTTEEAEITLDYIEKDAPLSTRVPKSIKRRLKALAKRENRTISNMIARIIVEHFKRT